MSCEEAELCQQGVQGGLGSVAAVGEPGGRGTACRDSFGRWA